jgi:arylformamidase
VTAGGRKIRADLLIDISRPIGENTPAWPGDVAFTWRATAAPADAPGVGSTCFTMSAHLGTHADAPSHVIAGGGGIGSMPLDLFLGPARVVELRGRGEVGADALPRAALGVARVLFRTRGGVFLAPLAALRLAERGAVLVGTDALSIDPEDAEDLPAHRALLSRGIAVLENLDLSRAEPGDYTLLAAPLAFEDLDASPVRAVLVRKISKKSK